MLRHEVEEALKEINKVGSDLHVAYHEWRNAKMTNIVMAIASLRAEPATVQNVAPTLPGSISETSTYILGFITGKSAGVDDIMNLDSIEVQAEEEPEVTFGVDDEEQGKE